MANAYYSTVFEPPADGIWKIIRDFNNYPVRVGAWARAGSRAENPATPSAVYQGRRIRQRLVAQSDVERSQTSEFCEAPTLPVTAFRGTLRVLAGVDGNRAFVEWGRFRLRSLSPRRTRRDSAGPVRKVARILA